MKRKIKYKKKIVWIDEYSGEPFARFDSKKNADKYMKKVNGKLLVCYTKKSKQYFLVYDFYIKENEKWKEHLDQHKKF